MVAASGTSDHDSRPKLASSALANQWLGWLPDPRRADLQGSVALTGSLTRFPGQFRLADRAAVSAVV